jgi:quinoprotein glucose dehydrogenase
VLVEERRPGDARDADAHRSTRRRIVLLGLLTAVSQAHPQGWDYYGGDAGGSRYSALEQINRDNVASLAVAWSYRTGEIERRSPKHADSQVGQNTPIIAAGSLIACTPYGRVIALDPENGRERWAFEPNADVLAEDAYFPKCRGVSQWRDAEAPEGAACRHRIIYGTWDRRVIALDAATGRRCPDFGDGGEVALDLGKPLIKNEIAQITSPPAVIGDVAVVGSFLIDSVRPDAPSGKVRAFDARTGRLRWEFDPVPRDPADPARGTWGGDSADTTGQANVWAPMSVDAERDLVFLPTTSPSVDFYGGSRPGENRYANSLVALRGSTGEVVWHFQITHHDLWDYDLPAQPILVDLPRNGAMVPAVVQLTKQALVFVFNRETGAPLFPIEERPVPVDGVEGEWISPTQPVPLAPPALVAQGIAPEDAWGFTPLDRWLCRREIEALSYGPLYTPPSFRGTIQMPSFAGGANWGGGAVDPERRLLIVGTTHLAGVSRLVPRAEREGPAELPGGDLAMAGRVYNFPMFGMPYWIEMEMLMSPLGVPCTAPPWGRLSAVDLVDGTIKWQVPLGSLEKLLPIPIPLEMGTPLAGGAIVTRAGLAFIGGSADEKFRAFDSDTGEVLWSAELPAGGHATPMTYEAGGRQFVVITAGGHALLGSPPGDYVVAFALPKAP